MISGTYLGEVVRRVLLRMSQESDIFGTDSSRLSVPFIFRCLFSLSNTPPHTNTPKVLASMFYTHMGDPSYMYLFVLILLPIDLLVLSFLSYIQKDLKILDDR